MRYLWVLIVAALLLGACGGDDGDSNDATASPTPTTTEVAATASPTATRTATATPTATASPVAGACPIAADACSFANQVAQDVLDGDGEAVMSLSRTTFFECPGPNAQGAGQPLPLCEGAPTGEMRAGFPFITTFQGEGSVVTEADAARIISEWSARAEPSRGDDFGDGAPRPYTIACADIAADDGASCGDEFSMIFSGLTPGASSDESLRWMLAVYAHRVEGELRAYRFASGVLDFGLEYALEGGTGPTSDQSIPRILAPAPEEGATTVTFFPWAPLTLGQ